MRLACEAEVSRWSAHSFYSDLSVALSVVQKAVRGMPLERYIFLTTHVKLSTSCWLYHVNI